jgi:hypothetical protein
MKNISPLLASIALALCGCASIVSKSNWPVTFSSNPSGARITITNEKNGQAIHVGETPASVVLKSGAGFFRSARYRVDYSKPGYTPTTAYLSPSINGWYFGNLLFSGVIGFLIVDPATGAMFRLPADCAASLSPTRSAKHSLKESDSLSILTIDSIPLHLRSQLQRVN